MADLIVLWTMLYMITAMNRGFPFVFYVVNPLTKRVRLLDHSGSMLLASIFTGPNKANAEERAMCVGFTLNQSRATTTKGFKIICILEIHTRTHLRSATETRRDFLKRSSPPTQKVVSQVS
ncbi:hypothetical protein Bca101_053274 [Brassica carinata]